MDLRRVDPYIFLKFRSAVAPAEVCTRDAAAHGRWLARACYLQSYGTSVALEQRDRSSLSLWYGDWGPLDRVSLPADKA